MIGDALADAGLDAEVRPAERPATVRDYAAVIVCGALYANRWHRHARRFVRRYDRELALRPVWMVASGPLDDSAAVSVIPPVDGVRQLMERIGARGHVTFGGRLAPDARGFPASAMAKTRAGDWRDPARIHTWATSVAAELLAGAAPTR
jgi:menaquinone-dependent protoporphyrinogen oxidase